VLLFQHFVVIVKFLFLWWSTTLCRNDVHVREKNSQSTLLHKAREEKMSSFGKTLSSSRSISEGKKSKFSSRSRTVGSTKKRSFHKVTERAKIMNSMLCQACVIFSRASSLLKYIALNWNLKQLCNRNLNCLS